MPAGDDEERGPIRTCIVTRAERPPEEMIRFVLAQDLEKQVRTPAQLPNRPLRSGEISRNHQPGLGDASELPFHQLGSFQGGGQILPGAGS